MTYFDSRELTKEMTAAYGRRCIRAKHVCIPSYWHLNYRLEADLLCVDELAIVHEVEAKISYNDFLHDQHKGNKYELMFDGKLDCNTFSFLVPESIFKRVMKECDPRFGIYCYYHETTKKKRVICKRKPEIIDHNQKGLDVFNNILRKSTLIVWSKK